MKRYRQPTARGFTLIEFIIVAVLIAITLIGILSYLGRAHRAEKVTAEIKGLKVIITESERYMSTSGFGGSDGLLAVLARAKKIPLPFKYVGDDNYMKNGWDGKVAIQNKFPVIQIISEGIPGYACYRILSAIIGFKNTPGAQARVNGTWDGWSKNAREMSQECQDGPVNTLRFDIQMMYQQ